MKVFKVDHLNNYDLQKMKKKTNSTLNNVKNSKMKSIYFLLLFMLLSLTSVTQNKTVSIDTVTYEMDTVKSYVAWACDKHYGIVPLKSSHVQVVNQAVVAGSFVLNMDSLKDLDIDYTLMRKTLHNTLKSAFFFDVAHFPTAEFILDYAEPLGNNYFQVSGNLQVKDIVDCIQFKSKITFDETVFTATSDTFDVDRTKYGITIYSPDEADDDQSVVVSNEIYFVVHLIGKRE
ncbi:MAG: hypothetical protein DRJ09_04275 [Bacteroidetes bacterium]|nr:MAG: hypothetical protein DRJ09_04275 [Bacteroidota bacterium]